MCLACPVCQCRKGPSCIEPMATNSLHHKAQVSIKEASDKPNPYSAYFFSPTWPSLAAAKQNSNSPDFRKLECACLTIDPEVAKSPTNGYTMVVTWQSFRGVKSKTFHLPEVETKAENTYTHMHTHTRYI